MAKKLNNEEKAQAKAKAEEKAKAKVAEDLKAQEESENLTVFPQTEKVIADKTEKWDSEAELLFKQHLNCNAFHFTSDGLAFFEVSDARNHASTLADKQVISKTRE